MAYDATLWEQRQKDFNTTTSNAEWEWKHRQQILQWIMDMNPSSLLDAGCLRGHYLGALRSKGWHGNYMGVDVTPSFLADARDEFPNDQWVQASVYDLADHLTEVVLCSELLQHLPDPQKAVERCCAAATEAVIISVQGTRGDTEQWDDHGFIDRAFSRDDALGLCPDGQIIDIWKESEHPRKPDRVYYQLLIKTRPG